MFNIDDNLVWIGERFNMTYGKTYKVLFYNNNSIVVRTDDHTLLNCFQSHLDFTSEKIYNRKLKLKKICL